MICTTINTNSLDHMAEPPLLTAAEIFRSKRARKASNNQEKVEQVGNTDDLDDEIKRLEVELGKSENDDDASLETSSSDSELSTKVKDTPSSPIMNHKKSAHPGVICLSTVAKDRIEPLPSKYLPAERTNTRSKNSGTHLSPSSKKPRNKDTTLSKSTSSMDALESTVKEFLTGYVARSSERLPFYCRVCAIQCQSIDEFERHKETEFHNVAVAAERKLSYCKLCRKQLTSPVQLKEHLTSKPHRERMDKVKRQQQSTQSNHDTKKNDRQWS
jgi:Zinc-finger of C2H2 type